LNGWIFTIRSFIGHRFFLENEDEIDQNYGSIIHDSRKGFLKKLIRKKIRSWNNESPGKPVVHESVFLRKLNQHNEESLAYDPWILKFNYDIEIWPEEVRKIKHLSLKLKSE